MKTNPALPTLLGLLIACSPGPPEKAGSEVEGGTSAPPSILLITLDTTRADAMGFESGGDATPNLDALAARGVRFSQAYTTAPMTLPAHASMLTGLYPAEHGIHENARTLGDDQVLAASRLRELGYTTAAFVSGLPLSRQFGLARGFDHYDDELGGAAERDAGETTARALAYLRNHPGRDAGPRPRNAGPLFLWVHTFDPHEPYDPPEPFRGDDDDPYLGEIAYLDHELGFLIGDFESRFRESGFRILVAGDHGEGRGDHGEALHGNLLYQGVMRVPLVISGSDVDPGRVEAPVSLRRVFDTLLHWAGSERSHHLLSGTTEVVLGEAMKPYLQYGWQPQVMAVRGDLKVIRSGATEVYDVAADPAESRDLAGTVEIDGELRRAIGDYLSRPIGPGPGVETPNQETRERLASLGYVASEGEPTLQQDAPSPRDMAHLFADLDRGSGLFVRQRYAEAIPVFERVLEQDPRNLMVTVRLAVAHSVLGREAQAMAYFERAREVDPDSVDLKHYLAMHHCGNRRWDAAAPLLETVLRTMPRKLPALECLARAREIEGRVDEAIALLERIAALGEAPAATLLKLGELRMGSGDTAGAIQAFEEAWEIQGDAFSHFLELGVLYLANRQLEEARDCLDRVPRSHPGYPMALFKRAQVSVLLDEPDREARIRSAWEQADPAIRRLIESESLFRGVALR